MKVTWKPAKDSANQKKHRLSFEAAQFVFDDLCTSQGKIGLKTVKCVGKR